MTCAVRCSVDAAGALSGARSARRARAKVSPGRARALLLRLTASERRKLRRTRGGRAVFRVTMRPATGAKRSGRVKLRLRG